jgi:putative Mn2+ efflux pump MntP
MGANAAIFGLLALCGAWAPANEFTLAWRFGLMDITILMYGFIYVVSEGIGLAIRGFAMSTELLHIMGFAIAFPLGLWMVRAGLVDCEGWDLFSYLQGTTGKDSKVGQDKIREREKKAAEKEKLENQKANLLSAPAEQGKKLQSQVEQAIDQGEFALAIKIQNRIASSNQTVGWRQQDLYRVIQGLLKAKNYADATPMMELYIESFDANRFEMQVSLIKIWLQAQRPRKALEYMQGLNQAFLAPLQIEQLQKLATYARKQIADGIVEVR